MISSYVNSIRCKYEIITIFSVLPNPSDLLPLLVVSQK
jgi:hypothetical protein